MSKLVWQKDNEQVDPKIMMFLAGDDVILDRKLMSFDIKATKVHVSGLANIHILGAEEVESIHAALDELHRLLQDGDFVLDERFEDGHSAIEWYLTEHLGDLGKKVHTGRSRNDQVLVATRLYLVDALQTLKNTCLSIATAFLNRAHHEKATPLPGYTHLQHGTVSSVELWMASFAEAFLDNAQLAQLTKNWIDCNPLGSAAGYGVNLPLDREFCTRELSFSRTQLNTLYVQNSRGKFELQVLMAFVQALQDVRRFAWDLSLYTSAEFDFIKLPSAFTTGSSIMPNKRNPDVVELLRATVSGLQGDMIEIQGLLSLPSGYHRDLQNTKGPMMRGIHKGQQALGLIPRLVGGLTFNHERMATIIESDMYATDMAIDLTQQGVPFRDAYRQAMQEDLSQVRPADSLAKRVSQGAPGNLGLELLDYRLKQLIES